MLSPRSRITRLFRVPSLLLVVALGTAILASGLVPPDRAWAGDGDASTGERVLGTFLGSVDGALIARALTLREERTPMVAILYAGAVCGGATVGYLVADDEDALTIMGIVLIPLAILNLVLPDTNPYDNLDPRGFPSALAFTGGMMAGGNGLLPRWRTVAEKDGGQREGGVEDWWKTALVRCVPQPAPRGARLAPIRISF